jgi:hypothetical protein
MAYRVQRNQQNQETHKKVECHTLTDYYGAGIFCQARGFLPMGSHLMALRQLWLTRSQRGIKQLESIPTEKTKP